MFFVKCGSDFIHDPTGKRPGCLLAEPVLNMAAGRQGSFSFKMPPTHPMYGQLHDRTSYLAVLDDNGEIWRGRVISQEKGWENLISVYAEGELAYLQDTVMRPYVFSGTRKEFLRILMRNHRLQLTATDISIPSLDNQRKFTLDTENSDVDSDPISVTISDGDSTWSLIDEYIIRAGYYPVTYKSGDTVYIKFVSDFPDSTQEVRFAENLLDLTYQRNAANVITKLIPYGATLESGDSEYEQNPQSGDWHGNRRTIRNAAAGDGSDIIKNNAARQIFGDIVGIKVYNDITGADELYAAASADLDKMVSEAITISARAADISLINGSTPLRVGYYHTTYSPLHGVNLKLLCSEAEIDLSSPDKSTYEFGAGRKTLTDLQTQYGGGGGGGSVTPASIVTATGAMTAEQKAQTRENIGAVEPLTPQQIADGAGAWLEDNLATPSTPPIDSTLSVANAAADAKVVGRLFNGFNAVQLISDHADVQSKTESGLTWSCTNGVFTINGTATSAWFENIYNSPDSIPEWFSEGNKLFIKLNKSGSSIRYIYFRIIIYKQDSTTETIADLYKDTVFTIPNIDNAIGLCIRVYVAIRNTVNGIIHPVITNAPSNLELYDSIEGTNASVSNLQSRFENTNSVQLISDHADVQSKTEHGLTWSCINGVFTINGTTTSSWYENIYNSPNSVPDWFAEGKRIFIKLNKNGSNIRYIYLRIYVYKQDGTSENIAETYNDTVFTVPNIDDAVGIYARVFIASGNTVSGSIHPVISNAPSNLELYDSAEDTNASVSNLQNTFESTDAKDTIDLVPRLSNGDTIKNGVTFSYLNGKTTINGTATSATYFKLCGNVNSLPDGVTAGRRYFIDIAHDGGKTARVRVECKVDGATSYIYDGDKSTPLLIPSGATGLAIYIYVYSTGVVENESITVSFRRALTNFALSNSILPPNPGAMMTIIDDDGALGFYTQLLPIIRTKHIPIASAIVGSKIGVNPAYMTWEQVEECFAEGAEILNHTYMHYGETDETRTTNEIRMDYTRNANLMQAHNIPNGDILVYPGGSGNMITAQVAAKRFASAAFRANGNKLNLINQINPFYIDRYRIESEYSYNIDQMKGLIDNCIAKGGWMVWMIHTSSGYNWNESALSAVSQSIDYAISSGLPIVTARYGIERYIKKRLY